MPIAHNLNKVTKNVSKSTGSMHIKGRKFKQLNRATLRDQKITAKKLKHQEQKDNELLVVVHFKDMVTQSLDKDVFSLQDMKDFVEQFISRFDDEIKQYQDERRPGRPASAKQKIMEEKRKHDQHVFETGYKIPDISDKHTVERLRLWNGTHGGVTVLKYVHIHKDMKQLPTKEVEMKE